MTTTETPTQHPPLPDGPQRARPTRRRLRIASAAVAITLAAGSLGAGSAVLVHDRRTGSATTASATGALTVATASSTTTGTTVTAAATAAPSVVSLVVRTRDGEDEGSGIVLDADGTILTNAHVVTGATAIEVDFADGTTASASVVGADTASDIAVVRATGVTTATPATFSTATPAVGSTVLALGNPLGLEGTVTEGIVSALDRSIDVSSDATDTSAASGATHSLTSLIQDDAAVNPGNSGGALVDLAGQVVGINNAIASLGSSSTTQSGSIGVGFAIPAASALAVAHRLDPSIGSV